MLKKNLIVLAALTILFMTVVPAIADTPEVDTEDLKKKKTIDEMLRLKSHGWPAKIDFDWVELEEFVVPVYMDVGLFLEILNIGEVIDEGILLEQVNMDCYEGCSLPFKIKCNFKLKLGCKITPTPAGFKMMRELYHPDEPGQDLNEEVDDYWDCEIRDAACNEEDEKVNATYCETIEERTIWVQFDNATIVHVPFGKEAHVADVMVRVKPDIDLDYDQWMITRDFADP